MPVMLVECLLHHRNSKLLHRRSPCLPRFKRVDNWELNASRWRPAFSSHLLSPVETQLPPLHATTPPTNTMNNSPKLNIDRQVRLRFGMTKRNKLARAARQKPMASGAALSHRSATPLPVAVLRNEMTCDRLSPLTLFRKGPLQCSPTSAPIQDPGRHPSPSSNISTGYQSPREATGPGAAVAKAFTKCHLWMGLPCDRLNVCSSSQEVRGTTA
jgi:hypothetical protein